MKCYKCGNEIGEGFAVCPVCATPINLTSPIANKILSIIRGKLFLAVCILISLSAGISLLFANGLPAINILAAIFLWITYAYGRDGVVNVSSMRCFSGVVYAQYILLNVVAVILAVCGLLLGGFIALIGSSTELLEAYMQDFNLTINGRLVQATEAIALGSGWLVAGFAIFVGAIMLLFSIFCWKKIHGFAKSVYISVQSGGQTPIINANVTRAWLWVHGIIFALGTLGSISNVFLVLTNGCLAAAYIIGAILVDKYFIACQNPFEVVAPTAPASEIPYATTPVAETPAAPATEQPVGETPATSADAPTEETLTE